MKLRRLGIKRGEGVEGAKDGGVDVEGVKRRWGLGVIRSIQSTNVQSHHTLYVITPVFQPITYLLKFFFFSFYKPLLKQPNPLG